MTPLENLTVEQLRKAVSIKEQIETLQSEIEAITSGGTVVPVQRRGRRKMSNFDRARIAAAARWAKAKTGNEKAAPTRKRRFSAAHRAALVAAQRARRAKAKTQRSDSIAAGPQSALLALARGAHFKDATPTPKEDGSAAKKRQISAAGRARIAAATKARWAKFRAEKRRARGGAFGSGCCSTRGARQSGFSMRQVVDKDFAF